MKKSRSGYIVAAARFLTNLLPPLPTMKHSIFTLLCLAGIVPAWAESLSYEKPYCPPPFTPAEKTFWVAPEGSDAASGSDSEPLRTLGEAVSRVSEHQQKFPQESITVFFRKGVYPMEKAVLATGWKGSAEKPIRLVSVEKGGAVLDGGKEVSGWEKLEQSRFWQDAAADWKERIRSDALPQIWVARLDRLGISSWGDPTTLGKRMEFFAEGKPQTLARWPNEGFVKSGKALGPTRKKTWNAEGSEEGIFTYLEETPSRWVREPDVRIFGYWFWDWAEGYARVEKIEPAEKKITLQKPFHHYGYKNGFRYYAVNLLCELDAPGEYFLDAEKQAIFWIPPAGMVPPETVTTLSVLDAPHMLSLNDCEHVFLEGFHFRYGRDTALRIQGGNRCVVMGCQVENFGRDAMHLSGGTENGVWNCEMRSLGAGGVALSGGNRKELIPCNHFVEECLVSHFSRVKRTYAPAVRMSGCGIRVAHNEFTDSSSSAISLAGNDFLIEYNRIADVVKESDDQGGIDCWYNPTYRGVVIRYNYWKNIVGGTHCGAAGVRLDDIISGFHIYGNIFDHCGSHLFGGIQIHGGKDNIVEKNLFFHCHAAISFSPWGQRYLDAIAGKPASLSKISLTPKMYEEVDIRSPKWQEKYPALKEIAQDPDKNLVRNNLLVNCAHTFLRKPAATVPENTVEVQAENATLESVLENRDWFEKIKISPLPWNEMGRSLEK
ncbi:MAG: right-handed parallel beta-helix repeat-containing protein [Planctomycetia bacterium]|nr:right-handed parallel beta-helix repeat-containing protein [Planctomycetia bacterium]